jgi:hypothetical protein
MKRNKKEKPTANWIEVIHSAALLLFLIGWIAACNRGTDSEPEPEDTNNLIAQPVVVSATEIQELTNELNQSVAPLKDGGFAIVWTAGEQISNRAVMMQWVDAQGNLRQQNGALRINLSNDDARDAIVIARPAGGVYVAFSQVDGQAYAVKVQAFDQTMTPLWPEPVNASIFYGGWESQTEPCLTAAPHGGIYVNYGCLNESEKFNIKCQQLDTAGNRLWGEAGITLGANYGFVTYPRAVPDNSGGLYVFWLNLGNIHAPVPEYVLVEGQHIAATGSKTWGNEPKVIHTTNIPAQSGYSYTDFMAAPDGLGGAIVAWYDDLDINDSQLDVLAQKVNIDGVLIWDQGVIPGDITRNCQPDSIIASNDGGVFISFREYVSPSVLRLWMQRLGANGEKLWGNIGIELSNPDKPRLNYKVYGYFTGKFLNLCWTLQAVPYTFDFDVVMARLKADGILMDPAGGVVVDNTVDKQFTRGMVYNEVSGEYFVLWEDSRRSLTWDDFDIYGAILKKASSSPASTPISYPVTRSLPAKKSAAQIFFRFGNKKLLQQRSFYLPGEKVVYREEK